MKINEQLWIKILSEICTWVRWDAWGYSWALDKNRGQHLGVIWAFFCDSKFYVF